MTWLWWWHSQLVEMLFETGVEALIRRLMGSARSLLLNLLLLLLLLRKIASSRWLLSIQLRLLGLSHR